MARDSVVFITAHPDDVAFSCGGTAWLLKRSYDLHVICASKGERGYRDAVAEPGSLPAPCPKTAAVRSQEERDSCELLGAGLTFLDQMDGEIHPDRDVCERVASMLSDTEPRAVLTHGPFEKKDHNAVFAIAYQALWMSDRFWETDLCMFHEDASTYNMQGPAVHVNIDEAIEHKKKQIECHASHLVDGCTVDGLLERNRALGRQAFCAYAEAFTSPFPMSNKRWGRTPECGRILLEL